MDELKLLRAILHSLLERHPAEVYGTPEHETILIEEERGT